MKLTIPHMGNIYLAVKGLFDGLGVDYIIPPLNSKTALEIGVLHSPEEICLPFKIMIGNYIEAIKQGADTIVITGSCGPCRFGEYCELQMKVMKKLGYDLEFIVLDAPGAIGLNELLKRVGKIGGASSKTRSEKYKALFKAAQIMRLMDGIEARAHFLAGYEVNRGECKRLLHACRKNAFKTNNPDEMIRLLKDYDGQLKAVKLDKTREPLKIGIIGEIYTIIEPFSNLYLEDKLMDYGVSTKRRLTPSWWVQDMALKPTKLHSLGIRRASSKYLPFYIGGHARECIGEAVLAHEEGMDGAIQIFPMGCMPEIVSKAILPAISRDKDFPILSLVVDEMTGEAGFITRVEAFLDLLERRKMRVLSRS